MSLFEFPSELSLGSYLGAVISWNCPNPEEHSFSHKAELDVKSVDFSGTSGK